MRCGHSLLWSTRVLRSRTSARSSRTCWGAIEVCRSRCPIGSSRGGARRGARSRRARLGPRPRSSRPARPAARSRRLAAAPPRQIARRGRLDRGFDLLAGQRRRRRRSVARSAGATRPVVNPPVALLSASQLIWARRGRRARRRSPCGPSSTSWGASDQPPRPPLTCHLPRFAFERACPYGVARGGSAARVAGHREGGPRLGGAGERAVVVGAPALSA